jgi:transposase
MRAKTPSIRVQDIDHCGIVAGIIDQMGLVEQINQELGSHPLEVISAGVAVKGMILNGLGMVSAPLYLFEKFFVGKATEHLLGEGIKAEHLNDDRLGRVLDQLFESGVTSRFVKIALGAAAKFAVKRDSIHLDSSSFHVHGAYLGENGDLAALEKELLEEPITITQGYSRDHRPDLKQFMMDLMCSGDGDVPLYLRVASGNESDPAIFAQLLRDFREQWDCDALFVADAALYHAENLQNLTNLRWLSRVPATIKEAEKLTEQLAESALLPTSFRGYRWTSVCSTYGGIKQRWLVVESDLRREADLKQLEKQIGKHQDTAEKQLQELGQQDFACQADALAAAKKWSKKLGYHNLEQIEITEHPYYQKAGRPKKGQIPDGYNYRVQGILTVKEDVVALGPRKAGRFVLATNVLESEQLSCEQMLSEYKAQQGAERGFRFLKDPMFFTSSVFLKTTSRVSASQFCRTYFENCPLR